MSVCVRVCESSVYIYIYRLVSNKYFILSMQTDRWLAIITNANLIRWFPLCAIYTEKCKLSFFICLPLHCTLLQCILFTRQISIGMNSRARRPPNVTFTVISMLSNYTILSCLQLIHFIQRGFRYCVHIWWIKFAFILLALNFLKIVLDVLNKHVYFQAAAKNFNQ